jgi:hypothetical protein
MCDGRITDTIILTDAVMTSAAGDAKRAIVVERIKEHRII